jgi:hypothetical protein
MSETGSVDVESWEWNKRKGRRFVGWQALGRHASAASNKGTGTRQRRGAKVGSKQARFGPVLTEFL